ncbi:alpha/beta hydrolase [Nocardia gipuzkoensis]
MTFPYGIQSMARRDVRFPSGDSDCAAWHYGPGITGMCVVMAHGLGAIKEVGLDRFARRFAAAGHDVLAFDYRFLGGSGGQPRHLIDIAAQQQDWRSAVSFARTIPGVRPDGIILWGPSYTGGHVLAVAAELGDDVAAAIAQAPIVDGKATARQTPMRHALRLGLHGVLDVALSRVGRAHTIPLSGPPGEFALLASAAADAGTRILNPNGHPWPNRVAARFVLRSGQYRPIEVAHRITCPLLVIAYDDDKIAPSGPATEAAQRAPHGELLRLPGDHYTAFDTTGLHRAVTEELEFIRQHVPPIRK